MPRPPTPTQTPFVGALPNINSPTTWDARTPPFWNWVTGAGYDNLTAVIAYNDASAAYIDAALAGSETVVDAVAALQSLINNCVLKFRGSIAAIPAGWQLCDGTNGTPDLRDKFIVGAGGAYAVGATGGANTVALTEAQMPNHQHAGSTDVQGLHNHAVETLGGETGTFGGAGTSNAGTITRGTNNAGAHAHNFTTDGRGGNQAHENRPPYYALAYIAKV